ncbi:MAG TPA: type VI secretion system tip protein TssI/VgrG [Bryobacteraceae bacterium]
MATIGFTQAARALRIDTPLGPDALLLRSVSGQEAVSQLFRFQLELLSEDDAIDFNGIVGKNVTLHLQIVDSERHINGFISRFSQAGRDERFTHYHAEMVPWLWFLTRKADCRIFQHKTAPDIIKKIFDELSFKDYELRIYNSYRTRDYCVQYRETDFNFVSRLMEEEGICYFFEHDKDGAKHTMVLADDAAAHKPCPGQPKARCDFSPGNWHPDDVISDWRVEQEYRPSVWSHTDYNFETPSTSLMVTVKDQGAYEIYDYPGLYSKKGDGDQLAKTRLQETLAPKERVTGKSNCRCFTTGATVEVTDHYRKEMNQKWMLTAVYHQSTMGEAYGSGGSDEGFFYTNTFECIPVSVPFRPNRVTPKPSVQGCQTAFVVGPAGEEIYPDKYGRVKVQFHWDREGKNNEDSSCWIRVAQSWAGKKWGAMFLPRIGHEVIVDFLEGDPDQPIIVGRVYNAEEMPPYTLPDEKTKSTVKSLSSKGGGGFNEIRFEDKKGSEQIFIHAERNQDIRIKNDLYEIVCHESHRIVKADHLEEIDGDAHLTIKGDQNEKVGGTVSLTGGADYDGKISNNYELQAGTEIYLKAGTNLVVESGTTLTLKVGGNFINLNSAGVFISGTMVYINSGGSAGSGVGASPQTPKSPKEADDAVPGELSVPPPPLTPPTPPAPPSMAATVLKQAAASGAPLAVNVHNCPICQAAG